MYDPTKGFKTRLKEMVRTTWNVNSFVKVEDGLYTTFCITHRGKEVDHTDGIGSKGHLHWTHRTFENAVQDVMAMNTNDLAMVGCTPYKTQVHLQLPAEDNEAIFEVMGHMVERCRQKKIVITGGETSINNLSSFDISMTMSGVLMFPRAKKASPGDVIVAIPSSGPHSNGFTLLRKLFDYDCRDILTPTADYTAQLTAFPTYPAMHITGGAFTKIRDIIPEDKGVIIKLPAQPTLPEFWREVVARSDINEQTAAMHLSTLNWGIGMVLAVPPAQAEAVAEKVGGWIAGHVHDGYRGVTVLPPPYWRGAWGYVKL